MGLINQRRSFRCPVATDRNSAELRFGAKRFPARLLDESADGFSIGLDEDPQSRPGQAAVLQTAAGCFEVEMVHCCRNEAAADKSPPCRFRMGVRRLRFLGEQGDAQQGNSDAASLWRRKLPAGWKLTALGILLVLGVTAGAYSLGGSKGFWRHDAELADDAALLWMRRPADSDPNAPTAKGGHADAPGPADRPRSDVDYWPANEETAQLRAKVEALPGAIALMEPSIASRLDLTRAQQGKIRHIIEVAQQACASYAAAAGEPGVDVRSKQAHVLNAAQRDAMKLLSAPQREAFQQLVEPDHPGN